MNESCKEHQTKCTPETNSTMTRSRAGMLMTSRILVEEARSAQPPKRTRGTGPAQIAENGTGSRHAMCSWATSAMSARSALNGAATDQW
jgi:hypothetical protein